MSLLYWRERNEAAGSEKNEQSTVTPVRVLCCYYFLPTSFSLWFHLFSFPIPFVKLPPSVSQQQHHRRRGRERAGLSHSTTRGKQQQYSKKKEQCNEVKAKKLTKNTPRASWSSRLGCSCTVSLLYNLSYGRIFHCHNDDKSTWVVVVVVGKKYGSHRDEVLMSSS